MVLFALRPQPKIVLLRIVRRVRVLAKFRSRHGLICIPTTLATRWKRTSITDISVNSKSVKLLGEVRRNKKWRSARTKRERNYYRRNLTVTVLEQVWVPASHTI